MDKTVVKAFSLLETLAYSSEPLGVSELARSSGLGKSNVHRLLQTLRELGYVSADKGSYSTSLRLWEVGSYAYQRSTLREAAQPAMASLSALTSETIHLSELDRAEVLYVDKIDGTEPVRSYTQLGGRAPAFCTATGKAILAYQDQVTIERAFSGAQKHTRATITDTKRFDRDAVDIRKRRAAVNWGEWRGDVMGIASPIADLQARVVAAIGISGPKSRLEHSDVDGIGVLLASHAQQISAALGCSGSAWRDLDRIASQRRTGSIV